MPKSVNQWLTYIIVVLNKHSAIKIKHFDLKNTALAHFCTPKPYMAVWYCSTVGHMSRQ